MGGSAPAGSFSAQHGVQVAKQTCPDSGHVGTAAYSFRYVFSFSCNSRRSALLLDPDILCIRKTSESGGVVVRLCMRVSWLALFDGERRRDALLTFALRPDGGDSVRSRWPLIKAQLQWWDGFSLMPQIVVVVALTRLLSFFFLSPPKARTSGRVTLYARDALPACIECMARSPLSEFPMQGRSEESDSEE